MRSTCTEQDPTVTEHTWKKDVKIASSEIIITSMIDTCLSYGQKNKTKEQKRIGMLFNTGYEVVYTLNFAPIFR